MSKEIQYRIVTKDLSFAERTILAKGELAKVQKMKDGSYILLEHPFGYGGFSSKDEMKLYTRKAKKKDIKKLKKSLAKKIVETVATDELLYQTASSDYVF